MRDVGANWTRIGFFRILERMGASSSASSRTPSAVVAPSEPICDLEVTAGPLVGTTVEADEVPLAIDELPLVALLGCFAEGETVVRGAQELRLKESDRIARVVDGPARPRRDDRGDRRRLRGDAATGGLRGGTIDAHGDHRLAMLGAVAGLASREGVEVDGMEAAAVSYPGFVDDLAGAGVDRRRGQRPRTCASERLISSRRTASSTSARRLTCRQDLPVLCGPSSASRPPYSVKPSMRYSVSACLRAANPIANHSPERPLAYV